MEKAGITIISPSATLPAFTESGLSNVIRLPTRIDAQGAFAARRILVRRPDAKLAVLDDGTPQMKAIMRVSRPPMARPPTLRAVSRPAKRTFRNSLPKLKLAEIDTLYVAASAPMPAGSPLPPRRQALT